MQVQLFYSCSQNQSSPASENALNLKSCCCCDSYWAFNLRHVVTSLSTLHHCLTAHALLPIRLLCKLKDRLQIWIFQTVYTVELAIA